MTEEADRNGIDFFDFVGEVWRTKWTFATVLIGVAGVAFLVLSLVNHQAFPKQDSSATDSISSPHYYGYFNFSISFGSDPFGRSKELLIADLWSKLSEIDRLGLVNDDDYVVGDPVPNNRFAMRPSKNYGGRISVDLNGGSRELAEQVRAEFAEAAKRQFNATKSQANADIAKLKELTTNNYTTPGDLIARKLYDGIHFLTDSKVQDGSFRFFEFAPLETSLRPPPPVKVVPPSTNSGPKKNIIIALILGLAFASGTVIVRIAIRQKHP